MNIVFLPDNRAADACRNENLLQAAVRAGVLIDASCAGAAKCGKCKVRIINGSVTPLTKEEAGLLTKAEIAGGYRLACCTHPLSDITVELPGMHGGSGAKKKLTVLPGSFTPENRITAECISVPSATIEYQLSDTARLKAACSAHENLHFPPALLADIHDSLEAEQGCVTVVFHGDELIGVMPGDTSKACYGVAFDIGTTTVVGMLWDLTTNRLVDVSTRTNYQSAHGADVISRIQFSMEQEENLLTLQRDVIRCCNDILGDMYARNSIAQNSVYDVTAVGNTTMSHLLLGITPSPLARAPFAPVFCAAQRVKAAELGLNVNPGASVYVLPNIAGHVGSDIVGMMLYADMDSLTGCHIAIDIGTNGEIVAVREGRIVTCSTAAGPAFEGATIKRGMRAAPGAIEKVQLTDEGVFISTIEDREATGICGSGLIDAVAQLLEAGIVEDTGRMLTREDAQDEGIPLALSSRIVTEEGHPAFLLYGDEENGILLTQTDIREVQLAKGAISAGISTLMKVLGMRTEDIDSIMLAGAFGNYIDKMSALKIGLLPEIDVNRIRSIGNAAGAGSSMALLSDAERNHASCLAAAAEHIELSMNKDFQEYYIAAMMFGEQDEL